MPASNSIRDPWYQALAAKYGYEFTLEAGYFEETLPFNRSYSESLGIERLRAPTNTRHIIQYSGAFWPLHEGHVSALQCAIKFLSDPIWIVLHVDHAEYRYSKGSYEESKFKAALGLLRSVETSQHVRTSIILEDEIVPGCSRNFTRLYTELCQINPDQMVWFLAGGDRAHFALSFVLEGRCLVIGRDNHPEFRKYAGFANERIKFLQGNHPGSSTAIRGHENG